MADQRGREFALLFSDDQGSLLRHTWFNQQEWGSAVLAAVLPKGEPLP